MLVLLGNLSWAHGQKVAGAGMFGTDPLIWLVPGGDGWKSGLSCHTGMAEALSLHVVSPCEHFISLHGSDNLWELKTPKNTKADASRAS